MESIRLLSLIMLLLSMMYLLVIINKHVVFISNLFLFIVECFSDVWIHGIFFVHSPTDEWKWKWKSLSCVQLFVIPWTILLQARILEWVAFPFSRGSSQPRDQTQVFLIARQIICQLNYKGRQRILRWVTYPFCSRFSRSRNWTRVSCIANGFFTNWAIRDSYQGLCFVMVI